MNEPKMSSRNKADHLVRWRWSRGVSGNPKGRPKKEQELRWFLEGTMLNLPISPEFYRNTMVILGLYKETAEFDAFLSSGAKLQDSRLKKIVPAIIRNLRYGEYAALRACFEAAKDPELFLKILDQIYGKPVQPTTAGDMDTSAMPASNVIIVPVPADEDEPQ